MNRRRLDRAMRDMASRRGRRAHGHRAIGPVDAAAGRREVPPRKSDMLSVV
jgi:hypothetical protein